VGVGGGRALVLSVCPVAIGVVGAAASRRPKWLFDLEGERRHDLVRIAAWS
jgi:hypothetical protein